MFCKDCSKARKKNEFTTGCKNLQRSALVRHMTQADHKSTTKVLNQQHRLKAAIDNASKLDEESLTKQMRTAYWLSKEEMPSSKFIALCELQIILSTKDKFECLSSFYLFLIFFFVSNSFRITFLSFQASYGWTILDPKARRIYHHHTSFYDMTPACLF